MRKSPTRTLAGPAPLTSVNTCPSRKVAKLDIFDTIAVGMNLKVTSQKGWFRLWHYLE